MGERVSSCKRLVELAEEVIFGPKTEGIVEAVKRDSNNPDCWHTLVRTTEGELKHFSNFAGVMIVTKSGTIRHKHVDMSTSPRIGDPYNIRTRGTGVIHPPGSKIDRDPFNLQESKPE